MGKFRLIAQVAQEERGGRKDGMLRIAILNYADVRNFGDVLFPMVVAREICARIPAAEVTFLTPTGTSWAGMQSQRYDRVNLESFHALILGGGEIVHRDDEMLKAIYALFGLDCIDRPTDLVFGWTTATVPFKAWLALGVPEPTAEVRDDISRGTQMLDFIGARGSRSAARLSASGAPARVTLTPDLGWLFPRLLAGRMPRPNPANGSPYLAVQATGFVDVTSAAAALRRVARTTGLRVVLLPLTRCWQDERPLSALQQASDGEFVLIDDSTSDLDKLAILGGATLYVGQSMHGLIGALSQCRLGGICLPDGDDKFGELLRDLNLLQFRTSGWEGVEALVQTLLWSPLGLVAQCRAAAEQQLDTLFDEVSTHLLDAARSSAPLRDAPAAAPISN